MTKKKIILLRKSKNYAKETQARKNSQVNDREQYKIRRSKKPGDTSEYPNERLINHYSQLLSTPLLFIISYNIGNVTDKR